jgi:hypothetical protein
MTISQNYAVVSRKQTVVYTSKISHVFDKSLQVQVQVQVTNLKCELINLFKNTNYLTDILVPCGLYVLAAVLMVR